MGRSTISRESVGVANIKEKLQKMFTPLALLSGRGKILARPGPNASLFLGVLASAMAVAGRLGTDWIQGYMYTLGRRGLRVSNSPVSS